MDNFNYTMDYRVRVADINYGGHVAGSKVLDYLQDARLGYLDEVGGYSELSIGDGCSLIMPEVRVKFLAEMFLGEKLEIGVRVSEIGRGSFKMEYRIERDGAPTAEATIPMIAFDYDKRRVRKLPKEFAEAVRRFDSL